MDPSYLPSTLLSNPIAAAAFTAYGAQVSRQMSGLFSLLNAHKLKYYFHVNNAYVLHKLYILLLPFMHRSWKRQPSIDSAQPESLDPALYGHGAASPASASSYRPPSEDVNAPDLYIPCMAFFTYVIVMSYCYASAHINSAFDPELIGVLASSALVALILETAVVRLGLYLIAADSLSLPHLLDLVAFISYKYVHCIVVLVVSSALPSSALFWLLVLLLGGLQGLFVMRTMKRALTPAVDSQTLAGGGGSVMRNNYFLLFLGLLQLVVVAFLVKGAL